MIRIRMPVEWTSRTFWSFPISLFPDFISFHQHILPVRLCGAVAESIALHPLVPGSLPARAGIFNFSLGLELGGMVEQNFIR